MLMRLLGAYCPNTEAGTIAGNPIAAAAPSPVFKKLRRETLFFRIPLKVLSFRRRILSPQPEHLVGLSVRMALGGPNCRQAIDAGFSPQRKLYIEKMHGATRP
jgi:hypothetical protein